MYRVGMSYLCRLADLLANHFPLVVFVFLDCVQQGLALFALVITCDIYTGTICKRTSSSANSA